ncbi:MAG: Hpt domain-containing protein [Cypionkella sp.]|nr:Hpt domain-containing protein [Cypionkella sp.]
MIDWDRVHELREEIGNDEFAEVVMMFLEEADEVLARISTSAGAPVLRDDCHFLKGAALNLGFKTLAVLCQTAEKRASDGDLGANLDELRACYRTSRDHLLAGMADLAA